jgi:hypothetical protein
VQSERSVERVAGLVSQNAHAFGVAATLDLEHLFPFELNQAWVREVERYGDARHAVRRKPLFRQPNVRFEADSAVIQLTIEPYYVGFEERPFNFDRQVADTQVKQLLVAETVPGESVAHSAVILVARGADGQNPRQDYRIFKNNKNKSCQSWKS